MTSFVHTYYTARICVCMDVGVCVSVYIEFEPSSPHKAEVKKVLIYL